MGKLFKNLFEEKKLQVYSQMSEPLDKGNTKMTVNPARPRNEKILKDYETWTNCTNENTKFVKNLFEEKNYKLSH